MKHFVEPNMSSKSQTTVKYSLKTLSSICDSVIFVYVGITLVVDSQMFDLSFIVTTLSACLISRIVGKRLLFLVFQQKK